jgi:hypothetical protein
VRIAGILKATGSGKDGVAVVGADAAASADVANLAHDEMKTTTKMSPLLLLGLAGTGFCPGASSRTQCPGR